MYRNRHLIIGILTVVFFYIIYLSNVYGEVVKLSDGIKKAIENSRLLNISRDDESISSFDVQILRSKMLPSINATVDYSMLAHQPGAVFGGNPVPTSERNFISYSFNVQQTLYDFNANSAKYKAGIKILETKQLDTLRIKNRVAIDFVLSYIDLLDTEKMIKVSEKEVEMLESHLRNAKNFYEEGTITKNDLLQAEVRLSDARQRMLKVKDMRKISISRLNNLLKRPLTEDLQVEEIVNLPSNDYDFDIQKAWDIAIRNRPEIRIIEKTIQSLNLEEDARKSEFYPKLFLKGGYDFKENRYQAYEGNWSLIMGMSINLFSGGSSKAEILKLSKQQHKMAEYKESISDEIKLEVERYIIEKKTAKERIAVVSAAVRQAEENLRINRIRYEEGAGTATDVLDAITLLTIAQTNYYKSFYDLKKAEAAVLYSIGIDLAEVYK